MKTKETIVYGVLAVILALAFTALSLTGCPNDDGGGKGVAPTITTTSLPGGAVGTAYSQTLSAAGDAPITWSIDTGSLPGGLNLSTAGIISGMPRTSGIFTFTVKATNAAGSGTKALSIMIATSTKEGDGNTTVIRLLYYTGTYDGGTFENWETFYNIPSSITGGRITTGDTYTFTYAFTANVDLTPIVQNLRIHFIDSSSGFTELSAIESILTGKAGTVVSGTKTLVATGTASSTDAVANRMQLVIYNASSDIPEVILIFTTFSLVKGGGTTGKPPTVTTTSLPDGTVGQAYNQTLTAAGDTPITWSIDTGSLPGGLNLSTAGVISGTPTTANTFNFTVKAANAAGNDTKQFSITIAPAPVAPAITTTSLPEGTVGTAYNQTLTAAGDTPITWSIDTGTLPGGLNLSTAGVISGTPTTANTFNFTVRATNNAGSVTKTLSIFINNIYNDSGTWTAVTDSTFGSDRIEAIAYGNNRWVAVGQYGKMAYSDDNGVTWAAVADSTFGMSHIESIAYGNNRFVAGGDGGKIAYSTDGIAWTAVADSTIWDYTYEIEGMTYPTKATIYGIAYGNNRFVAGGSNCKMAYSIDGVSWTAVSYSIYYANGIILGIVYGNNRFVAYGGSDEMKYSADGITWTAVSNSTFGYDSISAIAYGNNRFVAVGGKMAYSANGITWTAVSDSTFGSSYIRGIAYGNNRFVAVGDNGKMAYSANGASWTTIADSTFGTSSIYSIAYGNGRFVAVGENGKMAYCDW